MTIVKKNYYPFAFENTQDLVIFSMKVIFVERVLFGHFQYESHFRRERAIGTSKPVKVE